MYSIYQMKLHMVLVALVLACFQGNAQSKLAIGSVIQENQITDFNSQKLILIDFWATWCVPCIPAAHQLEVYQEQLKDEVYMIGISDENEYKIKRFVEQQDFKIAIYQDHNFYNVSKFDVQYRPYSVLLNAKGAVLWRGSPSELSVKKLRDFAAGERFYAYSLEDLFEKPGNTGVTPEFSGVDTLDVFAESMPDKTYENLFVKTDSRVYFEGDLIHLYSKLLGLPASNFETALDIKLKFGARANIWDYDKDRITAYLNNQFQLKIERKVQRVRSQELKIVDATLLWDTHQIDWGEDQINNYIIGEHRLEADNLSIKEICTLLSELKNKPFIYSGTDDKKYDWSFHYNYENLMKEELHDQFGIEVIEGEPTDVEIIAIKNSNS